MRALRSLLTLTLLGLLLVVLPGCGKVTMENYNKIDDGMTLQQVEGILGKGKESAGVSGAIGNLKGSGKVITWGDDTKSITVTFANDKVILKSQKGL